MKEHNTGDFQVMPEGSSPSLALCSFLPSWLKRSHAPSGTGRWRPHLRDRRAIRCKDSAVPQVQIRHLCVEKLKFCFFQPLLWISDIEPHWYPILSTILSSSLLQRLWGTDVQVITLILCLQSFSQIIMQLKGRTPKAEAPLSKTPWGSWQTCKGRYEFSREQVMES